LSEATERDSIRGAFDVDEVSNLPQKLKLNKKRPVTCNKTMKQFKSYAKMATKYESFADLDS
jgi:hypothetical protein